MNIFLSLEEILNKDNIDEAIQYLQTKKDSAGIDGISPSMLDEYWSMNRDSIIDLIQNGSYVPGPVRQFERISSNGKKRKLHLMNTIDRMLARAIAQVLSVKMDAFFYNGCFSYRKGLGVKDFAYRAAEMVESGNKWVVETDIENFFDNISHEKLKDKLKSVIVDETVLQFVESFISCQVETEEGEYIQTKKGLLQGMPLSPLFSNIFMVEFDNICSIQFGTYLRYGDDIRVFTKDKEESEEAKQNLLKIISEYGFMANDKKTGVFEALFRTYLGYEFVDNKGRIIIQRIVKQNITINRKWQRSSLREIDHNYHIINDGILTKKDFTLLFENENEKKYIPIEVIDSLNIYSNVIFGNEFFSIANREGFSVNIIDQFGNRTGCFIPEKWRRNFKTEMAQINFISDKKEHLKLAKEFQKANVFNIRAVLRYYERRSENETIHRTVEDITELIRIIEKAKTMDTLLLCEAQGRQKYFHCFNEIMENPDFRFVNRTRRPPKDALNAMISFGNTLLYTRFANEIYRSSLNIRCGIIHSSFKRPENLNLDLADLFKPVLVDRTIFTLVNKRMIDAGYDFEKTSNGGIYMGQRAKKVFIREFENKLNSTYKTDEMKHTYADMISKEVKALQNFFRIGAKYKPFKYVN